MCDKSHITIGRLSNNQSNGQDLPNSIRGWSYQATPRPEPLRALDLTAMAQHRLARSIGIDSRFEYSSRREASSADREPTPTAFHFENE
jgi:hypothetical protein